MAFSTTADADVVAESTTTITESGSDTKGETMELNFKAFMAHRQTCRACGSNGPALCAIGHQLLSRFRDELAAVFPDVDLADFLDIANYLDVDIADFLATTPLPH